VYRLPDEKRSDSQTPGQESSKLTNAESKIHSLFASLTSSLGYSEIHGHIIGALLVEGRPLSLDELAKKTGYSLASVSLSLDLLEFFGVIKKFRVKGNRKIYIKIDGDLLNVLKTLMLIKLQKNIKNTFNEFEKYKNTNDKKILRTIEILEKEIKRLEKYINELAKVDIPKDDPLKDS
jgi:DNA-binding transcriptional regulator GbsR (MarR family)